MNTNLSYVHPHADSPWGTYLSQVDRVVPYLGHLARWADTLRRPKRSLTTNADAGWFAGIEFNAERIQGVRVDFSGVKAASLTTSLPESVTPKAVIVEISKMIAALAKGATGTLLGIGVGVPGIVDPVSGIARDYTFIEGWKEVPLAQTLHDKHAVPVTLDNNLRTIALAERWFGDLFDELFGPY